MGIFDPCAVLTFQVVDKNVTVCHTVSLPCMHYDYAYEPSAFCRQQMTGKLMFLHYCCSSSHLYVKIQTVYNFFIMTLQERVLVLKPSFCIKENEHTVHSLCYWQTHQSCASKSARFFSMWIWIKIIFQQMRSYQIFALNWSKSSGMLKTSTDRWLFTK